MKGQVENCEIRRLPISPIQEQPLQKRDALHSVPFLDIDQMSYLPIVKCRFFHLFIQSPKEIDGDPSQRILFRAVDSKQGEEIPFEPFVLKWEKIEDVEALPTPLFLIIIIDGPDSHGFSFLFSLRILTRIYAAEKDAIYRFMEIWEPVLFISIEGIDDEDPLRLPFSHFVTIKNEKSLPVEVFSFKSPKKWPGEIPLFETCALLFGMGEERPENGRAAEIFGLLRNIKGKDHPFIHRIVCV
jgi:hypothetical protein